MVRTLVVMSPNLGLLLLVRIKVTKGTEHLPECQVQPLYTAQTLGFEVHQTSDYKINA